MIPTAGDLETKILIYDEISGRIFDHSGYRGIGIQVRKSGRAETFRRIRSQVRNRFCTNPSLNMICDNRTR